jgi:membrane-bound lytic murein transglycosylase B
MASIPPAYRNAFIRWGYLADNEAKKYGLPNGATLLAKIAYVESRFSADLGITSSAGAQGPMQFMPTTREEWMKRFGLDPWKSVDEAVHSGGIFMKTLGLDHYNPGSSTYISEVLRAPVTINEQSTGPGRRVGAAAAGDAGGRSPAAAASSGESTGGTLVHVLVAGVLVLGGAAMVGLGLARAAGGSPFDAAAAAGGST